MDQAPPSAQSPPRGWPDLVALLLLALFWWQAVSASVNWSQTSDELPHLTAGYTYDKFGDYRLHAENGILPQRVHGLAPLALGAVFPMDEARWRISSCWQLGWDFLYGMDNPTDRMLHGARALNALFGVALGAFIFMAARRLHGPGGGLVALGFYAFCPNFLAHSALATSDLAGTLCLTLASWFFWQHLERRDIRSGALAGLFSGLALVAKFNGVLLAPIYAGLALADALGRREAVPVPGRLGRNLLLCFTQALAAVLVIWAFYGFRYDARGAGMPVLERFAWTWPDNLGAAAPLFDAALRCHLLPQAWLHGLANVLAGAAGRPAFFAGEYRLHGWWQFFPTLFLLKTPLAMLTALASTLGLTWAWLRRASDQERRSRLLAWVPLACPAAIIALTAVAGHLNIGHRHILAVYPVLFIALGGLGALPRRWLALPAALLVAQAAESLAIRPHYLAFFNPLAGGPAQAHRLVADSSLDWGQDLPALRDWLARNRQPHEPLYLAYFGSAWPPHYGVRPDVFLPEPTNIVRPPFAAYTLKPGLYCISATSLSEVYTDFRGPWRTQWETRLQAPSPQDDPARLDELRFARLCKYLQQRPPDAQAGYSILIYRLGPAEIAAALQGPVTGW